MLIFYSLYIFFAYVLNVRLYTQIDACHGNILLDIGKKDIEVYIMQDFSKNENATPHKRRAHYSGKYPKKFEEKYKELQPEKYSDIAEHVKAKGMTPAGTHISIMVDEILEFLQIKPGQQGLDCTFGYGGHSSKMLEKLEGKGHLVSLDVDPIESAKSRNSFGSTPSGTSSPASLSAISLLALSISCSLARTASSARKLLSMVIDLSSFSSSWIIWYPKITLDNELVTSAS